MAKLTLSVPTDSPSLPAFFLSKSRLGADLSGAWHMPVPTSPVRPVLAKLRRVRTWLPSLSVGTATLALLIGWAGVTDTGAALAGPLVAWALIAPDSPAPSCEAPWHRWAALMRGVPVDAPIACPGAVAPQGFRLRAAEARAGDARTPARIRAGLLELLLVHPDTTDTSLERVLLSGGWRGSERGPLLSMETVERSSMDLVAWSGRAALGGTYDRSVLLDDPDSFRAVSLLPLAADLDADEQALLALNASAFPERRAVGPGAPPPAVGSAPPPDHAAPAAVGVLALVPEQARDHLAEEWAALVAFVADGPVTAELAGPEDRWRLASTSALRAGSVPPPASVHAALRGEPATAALGAWLTLQLALDAGLPAEAFVRGGRLDVHSGGFAVRTSACGQRFPVSAGEGTPLPAEALRAEAASAVASAALASGDVGFARDLLATVAPAPPALELALAVVDLPPGWELPPPPPPPRRNSRRGPPAPAPEPAPTPAERAAALEPRGAALSPEERALLAWWAESRGHRALAERWSAEAATGPAEAIRRRLLARIADPAALPTGGPVRADDACSHPEWPWPPDA